MKVYITAILAAGILVACARTHPVYNVNAHPIPVQAQSLSLERIETLIVEAGQSKGWKFDRMNPGKLRATLIQPSRSAVVEVTFDNRSYSINHVSTTGLRDENDGIHGRYNRWIRQLEQDIDVRLTNAPIVRGS